jgi:hypothetical protein
MSERVRSKLMPVSLVYVDREFVEQALDHMRMMKTSTVTFEVMNNICTGIESAPGRLMIESSGQERLAATGLDLDDITDAIVLEAVAKLGQATAPMISNELGIQKTAVRAKVWRTLIKLRQSGTLMDGAQKGHYAINKSKQPKPKVPPSPAVQFFRAYVEDLAKLQGMTLNTLGTAIYGNKQNTMVYQVVGGKVGLTERTANLWAATLQTTAENLLEAHQGRSASTQAPPKMPTRVRSNLSTVTTSDRVAKEVTEENVIGVLATFNLNEEFLARDVSDRLGLPRQKPGGGQNRDRIKVTGILNQLLRQKNLVIVGQQSGIMPIYKLQQPLAAEA